MIIYGKQQWGPKAWHLLHSFSNNNNFKINEHKKHNYFIFYTSFIFILPCLGCRQHYTDIIYNSNPLEEKNITRIYLKKWVFDAHNIVNEFLNKPLYSYKKFNKEINIINHSDNFFIIKIVYSTFEYDKMALYVYDQIYNFFINFCALYPNITMRNKLKKLIKKYDFTEIETPLEFKHWFYNNLNKIENILRPF